MKSGPRPIVLAEQEITAVVEFRARGMSWKAASARVGYCWTVVRRNLVAAGWEMKGRWDKWPAARQTQLNQLLAEGLGPHEIARRMGTTNSAMRVRLCRRRKAEGRGNVN